MASRKDKADNILNEVVKYLEEAAWTFDSYLMLHVDPVTSSKYPTDIAFAIQLGRDLTPK